MSVNERTEHPEQELVGAYVLDALEPDEQVRFEAHLRSCDVCRSEVAELQQVSDVLPLSLEPVEPPAGLRDRLLAAVSEPNADVEPEPLVLPRIRPLRRMSQVVGAIAAALIIAGLGIWNLQLHQKVSQQQSALAFQQQVATAIAHHARVLPVSGTNHAPSATAAVIAPRRGHPYLIVQGLPRPSAHRVYQVWLVRSGAAPRSARVFSGSGLQIVPLHLPIAGYAAAAVTVEPGPRGSRQPTGPKVLIGKLSA
jgi:anti-sigma-K factor RskA